MTHRQTKASTSPECRGQFFLNMNATEILLVTEKPWPRMPRGRVGFLALAFVPMVHVRIMRRDFGSRLGKHCGNPRGQYPDCLFCDHSATSADVRLASARHGSGLRLFSGQNYDRTNHPAANCFQCRDERHYCSWAYSAFACLRIGMSGSASFHNFRKSSYAARALIMSPCIL